MKLYYSSGACSLASHIIANEAKLPVEIVKVDLGKHETEDGKDYYTINPKGYVPALEMKDGVVLAEGVAILQYLADQNESANLIPKAGTADRYKAQEWLTFISSEIHKNFSPLFGKDLAQDSKEFFIAKLHKRFAYVEKELAGKEYLFNNTFSVVDAYFFTVASWSKMLSIDLSSYPNIGAFLARIGGRPSVKDAMTKEGILK